MIKKLCWFWDVCFELAFYKDELTNVTIVQGRFVRRIEGRFDQSDEVQVRLLLRHEAGQTRKQGPKS